MPVQTKKNAFLGSLAALFSTLSRRPKPADKDLKNADFKTGTQSMGIRFTERIRDVFRFRWIRKI
jgi:hypothetical protein